MVAAFHVKPNGKVNVWDSGPDEPKAPARPDIAEHDPEYEITRAEYEAEIAHYRALRREHEQWNARNPDGKPELIELWPPDARHAIAVDPERYELAQYENVEPEAVLVPERDALARPPLQPRLDHRGHPILPAPPVAPVFTRRLAEPGSGPTMAEPITEPQSALAQPIARDPGALDDPRFPPEPHGWVDPTGQRRPAPAEDEAEDESEPEESRRERKRRRKEERAAEQAAADAGERHDGHEGRDEEQQA